MAYPTGVAFQMTTATMGAQPIHVTSTTQLHAIGTVVRAKDPTYGEGTFVYLKGAASTAKGDLCFYDGKTGLTVRGVHGGAGSNGPACVAMSANVANQYGWYQTSGATPVKAATVAANAALFLTATAGQVDDAAVNGDTIDGMVTLAADSAGYATCQLNNPNVTGLGTSSGSIASVAAIGSTPNANGMTLSGTALNLEPASASFGGIVTAGAQSWGGAKTLTLASASLSEETLPTLTNGAYSLGAQLPTMFWMKFVCDYTMWFANSSKSNLTLFTLPALYKIKQVLAAHTVAYTVGSGATLVMSVGASIDGDTTLLASLTCKSILTRGLVSSDMGGSLGVTSTINGGYTGATSNAPVSTNIYAPITIGTGTVGNGTVTNLTAGSTTFKFLIERIPA